MEALFKALSSYGLNSWMIFIIVIFGITLHYLKDSVGKLLSRISYKKDEQIKDLIHHDLFNTFRNARNKVKNMKFYSHGKYDVIKTKMCVDFTLFKTTVCAERFEKFVERDFGKMTVDELKNEILDEMSNMHIEYIDKITAHWINKGLNTEDVYYIVELFERFRFDVVEAFATRIDAIFSASYHSSHFKKMLACFDMVAMGVDLLPKDMQTTFESLNGRFANLEYK